MANIPNYFSQKEELDLNTDTSVEKSLNSRCSSDCDNDPLRFHWGMYDSNREILPEHLGVISQSLQVPRFSNHELITDLNENPILLSLSSNGSDETINWAHIESGMQQQAVHLACSAMGIGTCIKNLGINGAPTPSGKIDIVRMELGAMLPSYGNSYWSTSAPENWLPHDTLPEPRRDGNMPLLSAMENASTSMDGREATVDDISQLLWSARGRTPHYVLGACRGLTIPTWGGKQDLASVYIAWNGHLCLYINSDSERSTHALKTIDNITLTQPSAAYIILTSNEDTKRSLWEIGYMLEDLILQAIALGIGYKTALTDAKSRGIWSEKGVSNAQAIFKIKINE